jgi:hypothetical protein
MKLLIQLILNTERLLSFKPNYSIIVTNSTLLSTYQACCSILIIGVIAMGVNNVHKSFGCNKFENAKFANLKKYGLTGGRKL